MLLNIFLLFCASCFVIGESSLLPFGKREEKITQDESTLKPMLFRGYDRDTAPPGQVEVTVGVTPTCVRYNSAEGVLTTNIYLQMFWKDSRLSWDPTQWNGIQQIRLFPWHVWMPDLALYNSLEPYMDAAHSHAILTSDGYLTYVFAAKLTSPCKGNSCKLRIGSWTYNGQEVALRLAHQNGMDASEYDEACPWTMSNLSGTITEKTYECCPGETYPVIDLSFNIAQSA